MLSRVMALATLTAFLLPAASRGQQASPAGQGEEQELAKKLSNPISDLVSVPFQFNWEQGVGPDEQTRFILNVHPVMPFQLNEDWNVAKLSSFGPFPASYHFDFGVFAAHPEAGPSWKIRSAIALLLPRRG